MLLTYVGWNDDGYYVSTIGEGAVVVDSFSHPIPSLRTVLPIGRQAPIHQVDDSTCAILPTHAREFALYRGGRVILGKGVEDAPIPRVEGTGQAFGASRRVARGTRHTSQSAASWRGRVLLLHVGSTPLRRRLVDFYGRDLRYEMSVVLPFDANLIAATGDTLIVLGEREDEPMLAAYLLRHP